MNLESDTQEIMFSRDSSANQICVKNALWVSFSFIFSVNHFKNGLLLLDNSFFLVNQTPADISTCWSSEIIRHLFKYNTSCHSRN